MQESNYKLSAIRTICDKEDDDGDDTETATCFVTDYGISQINFKNVKRFHLNKYRLLNDLKYSVDAGAMILAEYSRYQHREPVTYFCRYNQGTKPFNQVKSGCLSYLSSVQRWL